MYWRADKLSAAWQIEEATLGNGFIVRNSFDELTGKILKQSTVGIWTRQNIQSVDYSYDDGGHLKSRFDKVSEIATSYEYDSSGRLARSEIISEAPVNVTYGVYDEIRHRSDVGEYHYGEHGLPPSQLSSVERKKISYDREGRQEKTFEGDVITYTSFGKPRSIRSNNGTEHFSYGPSRELLRTTEKPDRFPATPISRQLEMTTTHIAGIYEISKTKISTRQTSFIIGPNGIIAAITHVTLINEKTNEKKSSRKVFYLHSDQVGSLTAVSDENGKLVAKFAYSAWGEPKGKGIDSHEDDIRLLPGGFAGYRPTVSRDLLFTGNRLYSPQLGILHRS